MGRAEGAGEERHNSPRTCAKLALELLGQAAGGSQSSESHRTRGKRRLDSDGRLFLGIRVMSVVSGSAGIRTGIGIYW